MAKVAPPRGERGLKFSKKKDGIEIISRSPSWGAWIEIRFRRASWAMSAVAPPRGERGLKYFNVLHKVAKPPSLPLVGSVD